MLKEGSQAFVQYHRIWELLGIVWTPGSIQHSTRYGFISQELTTTTINELARMKTNVL